MNLNDLYEMRDSRDAYQRDVANSTSGFGKNSQAYRADGGANDERHDLDQQPSTWYIRLNGKLIRDKSGNPYSFQSKAAANKAALTMQAKLFNKDKEFMLTTNPNDKVAEGIGDLGYEAQSLITKLRRDVEEKRLQPTRQAVLAAASELAGNLDFAPELLVQQVLGKGITESDDYSAVTSAITRRIITQHPEVLAKYGPAIVGQAIDEIADFVGDVDEIGSSDVSGWVSQVIRSLGRFAPVRDESVAEAEVDSDGYSVDHADSGEYDYEGDQAKDQLNTIVRAARRLDSMLDDNENMPEWVQMKITNAADYIDTAADYIESNQEPELDEGEKVGNMDADKFDAALARMKKLAGAGPMKTVWDPAKRVYKNIPTAVQPRK